jgi:erythromycin esterase-like protein
MTSVVEPPELAGALRALVQPFDVSERRFDAFMDAIGDARFVLIGEATHGTHEFYYERAELTKRLIDEKGFHAVAVEADWPDAYRVNSYVRHRSTAANADEALGAFKRFPTWMWRNTEVRDFVEWLRLYNRIHPAADVGFYGLDLYSLHTSIASVLEYLDSVDPDAARRARYRYACFEDFAEDGQSYGYAANFGLTSSCEDAAVQQLLELRQRALDYARRDGRVAEDDFFFAEQNARLVLNAEQYYRTMFGGRVSSWNLRDRHMAETLTALAAHFARRVERPKLVVWEHNSHVGDARHTQMGEGGELNVGQLVRERYADETFLIGFTTYHGTVTAASDWDGPGERKLLRPALDGSYEALFHAVDVPRFLVLLRSASRGLQQPRLERAVGASRGSSG